MPLGQANFGLNLRFLYDEESLYGTRQTVTDLSRNPITWAMEKTFFLSWLSALEKRTFARELSYQASNFQFVRETINALLMLHQWCQSPSHSSLYAAAHQHHIEASALFRTSHIEVNEANWIGILMFGIGVIIFQFATVLKASDEADDYLEMLRIMRSSFYLSAEIGPFVASSPIMFLTGQYLRRLELHLDESTWNSVCRLDSLDYPDDTTEETRAACLRAIAALKEWVVNVDGNPGNWRQFIEWPATVPDEYLSALSSRHPVALVVFVYWCSIMHRSPKRWFMVGWANRAADAAMRHLGEEWDPVLEFPRAALASEPKSVKASALASDHLLNLNIFPLVHAG
ncbi:hypothetical protein Hte_002485 [Hypoxylon texense]